MLDKQNKALMLPWPFRGMGVPRGGGKSPDWGGLHAGAEAGRLHARARRATGVQVVVLHARAEAG